MDRLSVIRKALNAIDSLKEKADFLISISGMDSGRRVLSIKSKRKMLSHVIWNLYNPDDKVKAGEHVHHKNEDTLDDHIDNYEKLSNVRHGRLHYEHVKSEYGGEHPLHSPEVREKAASRLRGRKYTDAHKAKIGDANRGRKHTVESRANMSEAHTGYHAAESTKVKMSAIQRKRREAGLKWKPKEALTLRASGMTQKEVGLKLGVHPSVIRRYFELREVVY